MGGNNYMDGNKKNKLLLLICILFLFGNKCTSDKDVLIAQFDDYVEPKTDIITSTDPFFAESDYERWFLFGQNKVGVFVRHLDKEMNDQYAEGHYMATTDFEFIDLKITKFEKSGRNSYFRYAFSQNSSIIAIRNTFNSIAFKKTINKGETWSGFFYAPYTNGPNIIKADLNNYEYKKFVFHDEYLGVFGISYFGGIEIYQLSEGKADLLSSMDSLFLNDIKFLDYNRGWILCRELSNVLPSDKQNSYLFSTTDGGRTWSDKMLISNIQGYDKIIPINENIIIAQNGRNLERSEDGGKTWGKYASSLSSNLTLGSDGRFYNLKRVKNHKEGGLYFTERSLDYGETWTKFSNDSLYGEEPTLVVDEIGQALVYFRSGQVFLSIDKGSTWKKVKNQNVK